MSTPDALLPDPEPGARARPGAGSGWLGAAYGLAAVVTAVTIYLASSAPGAGALHPSVAEEPLGLAPRLLVEGVADGAFARALRRRMQGSVEALERYRVCCAHDVRDADVHLNYS